MSDDRRITGVDVILIEFAGVPHERVHKAPLEATSNLDQFGDHHSGLNSPAALALGFQSRAAGLRQIGGQSQSQPAEVDAWLDRRELTTMDSTSRAWGPSSWKRDPFYNPATRTGTAIYLRSQLDSKQSFHAPPSGNRDGRQEASY